LRAMPAIDPDPLATPVRVHLSRRIPGDKRHERSGNKAPMRQLEECKPAPHLGDRTR
jgi:hypothetical protein